MAAISASKTEILLPESAGFIPSHISICFLLFLSLSLLSSSFFELEPFVVLCRFLVSEGMEKTYHFKQKDIVQNVDLVSGAKNFDLKLKDFGPYRFDYSRTGRFEN